jgi:hypothetical protein
MVAGDECGISLDSGYRQPVRQCWRCHSDICPLLYTGDETLSDLMVPSIVGVSLANQT